MIQFQLLLVLDLKIEVEVELFLVLDLKMEVKFELFLAGAEGGGEAGA